MAGEFTTYETLPDGRTRMTVHYADGHTWTEILPVGKRGLMPIPGGKSEKKTTRSPGVDVGSLGRRSRA